MARKKEKRRSRSGEREVVHRFVEKEEKRAVATISLGAKMRLS